MHSSTETNKIVLSQQLMHMLHLVIRIEKSLKCPGNISRGRNGSSEVFNNILTVSGVVFYGIFISCGVSLVVMVYSLRENMLMW